MRLILASLLALSGVVFSSWPLPAAPPTSITLDGSFGTSGNITATTPHLFSIPPSAGKSVGANLFQSFGTFNLGTGDTAAFGANAGTQNIIARVTGGSASNIDGTLQSPVNLFFLNPAGVMFTANAQVNVTGSFVVSTANYAKLSDGTFFYADISHPIVDAGLTSAPVSAFGFLSATPQPITFSGSQITMTAGTGLHVIGGNITLGQGSPDGVTEQGANLLAPSGALTLFSAASAGEVAFSLASPGLGFASATNTAFGTITLRQASSVAIDGAGGGRVVIRGGRIVLGNSTISSANSGVVAGGEISVQADQLLLQDGGVINSTANAAGQAGDVSITANSAIIGGTNTMIASGATGIFSTANTGTGDAGDILVEVANNLSIINTGQISAVTESSGNAGAISVQAGSLTIDGSATPGTTPAIVTDTVATAANGGVTGSAGGVVVSVTGALTIAGGGEIGSNTFTSANAGEVFVQAGSLNIDGSATPLIFTGIASDTTSNNAASLGNAGEIFVAINGALSLTGGGEIATDSFTAGNAGDIEVAAGSLAINGLGSTGLTGITSSTDSSHPASVGQAGTIMVFVAGAISISNTGEIDGSTNTRGMGGDVTVEAASLAIDGSLSVIRTDASALGNGGDVTVNAGNTALTYGGSIISSSIESNAGNITINGSNLTLQDSSINTSAGKDGGAITLNVDQVVYLLNSSITSEAGGGAATSGGNIALNPNFVVLNHSLISANDPLGTGGNITINTSGFFNNVSAITATGSTDGVIDITTPDLNLNNSLVALSAALVSDERRLRESCARSVNHEFSTFTVVGRGGTESGPLELQPDFGLDDLPVSTGATR